MGLKIYKPLKVYLQLHLNFSNIYFSLAFVRGLVRHLKKNILIISVELKGTTTASDRKFSISHDQKGPSDILTYKYVKSEKCMWS